MKKPIGEQIDSIKKLDDAIDKVEAALKKLKQKRERLELRLLRSFKKDAIDGAKGTLGVASIRTSHYPSIKDMRKFRKYVIQHKAWDLYQNRIAAKAYFDRLEEGESVPGVTVFDKTRVSVRRRE